VTRSSDDGVDDAHDGGVHVDFQRPFSAPEGAQELVLVRHGSVVSPTPVVEGAPLGRQNDPPLDERGRHQAAAVAVRLEEEPIGAVFVTPLKRTVETAEPLLARNGFEPRVIEDLREVELGDWEHGELSRRAAAADPDFQRVMREQRWELIPNAEPAAEFAERIGRGMDEVADAAPPESVAVVYTHSAVIAEACRLVTNSEPFAFMAVSNCSLTRLVRMPGRRWVLVAFNETAHLPLEWQPRRRHGGVA
jgi:2,3-bisphosphoglycerate-dependent phosphoglycerate mutase